MGTDSVRSGFRLKPTAAVVVGAGPGLGRSCALTLARSGAEVFCVDIDRECATSVAEEIRGVGGAAFPFSGDMVVRADVDRMVSEAVTALGRIDACIDVVGWSFRDDIRTMDDETWDRNFALNLRHSFYITQIVGRQMTNSRTRGSIVHVSSVSSLGGHAGNSGYAAAKAALNSLVRTASVEYGPHGVRVNAVAPGTIDTPRLHTPATEERRKALGRSVPLGGQGVPQDIANLAIFLASDLAGYISGQVIVVDGAVSNVFPLIDGVTWRPAGES